jgi:hypothetical protein
LFTVTVGVMYFGAFVAGFVGPTGGLAFEVEFYDVLSAMSLFVEVGSFVLLVASVVPLSDFSDAFIAAAGATGATMNGTAVNAAMVHTTATRAVCWVRRFNASMN